MNDSDIIELIEDVCEDKEEISEYIAYFSRNMKYGEPYEQWLLDHDRCPRCGSDELRVNYIKEVHTELEEKPIERIVDSIVCLECGEVIE